MLRAKAARRVLGAKLLELFASCEQAARGCVPRSAKFSRIHIPKRTVQLNQRVSK